MTSRTLAAMAVAAALALCGCYCDSGEAKALIRQSGERWVLAGRYRKGRGSKCEDWVATRTLPDGTITRLVPIPMKPPDAESALFPTVAYSEPRKLLICVGSDCHDDNLCDDVWRYDLATGRSRWIAKARWNNTCGFAWSPDGSKLAFVASTRGSKVAVMGFDKRNAEALKLLDNEENNCLYYVSEDNEVIRVGVRTVVMQYDVDADKLEQVADDACRFGDNFLSPRRPVYSVDGHCLYYVSADRHVMRVDLRRRRCERLPFTDAFAVLTVKGGYLVYARGGGKARDWRFQIVKVALDAPDDSHCQLVYSDRGLRDMLSWNLVSPSRRFILFSTGGLYPYDVVLLDVETGTTHGARGLLRHRGFTPDSTVFNGPELSDKGRQLQQ